MTKKVEEKDVEKEFDEYEELTLEDRVMNIEKKVTAVLWLVVITMIVAILSLIFVISDDTSKTKTTEETDTAETQSNGEYDVSKFKEVKAQDLNKLSKDKTILVYIGRETCGYCVQFVPVLKEVQEKYSYTTYYIDIAKILDYTGGTGALDAEADKIMQNFATSDSQKDVMNDWGATPMTLIIKNNKIVDSLVGAADAATLETLVKNNGLAK